MRIARLTKSVAPSIAGQASFKLPIPTRATFREDDQENSLACVGNYPLHYLRFRPDCGGVAYTLRLRTGWTPPRQESWSQLADELWGNAGLAPNKGPKNHGTLTAVAYQAEILWIFAINAGLGSRFWPEQAE